MGNRYKDIELTRPEIMTINLRDWRQATYTVHYSSEMQLLGLHKRMRGLKFQNQLEIHASTPYVARWPTFAATNPQLRPLRVV